MIIIKLKGGLGNQLFQYALGKSIKAKIDKKIKFDLSWYKQFPQRQYKLNNFNAKVDIASFFEMIRIRKFKKKDGRRYLLFNLFRKKDALHIKEEEFCFQPDILNIKKNAYLDGNWQNEKYFKDIENIIREEIILKNEHDDYFNKIKEKTKNSNSISLHVRRGDYTSKKVQQILKLCSLNYYNKAIKIIKEKIENPTFFIFSDDIEWAKKNLKTNFPTIFVSNNTTKDYEELILMSNCKHHIIANSSFSWWGAWLDNKSNKIVIAPKKWFRDKKMNTQELTPKDWLRI
jgi:hypothetical protein